MAGIETPKKQEQKQEQSNETQKILKQAESRQKIYPKLTTENLDEYKYKKLIEPIKANPGEASETQKEFLKNMEAAEKELKNVGMSEFSYHEANRVATSPADKGLFESFKRTMDIVKTKSSTSGLGSPNLEKLFSAKDQSEFDSQMADPNTVQKAYSNDADFKSRAQKVFDYIQNYRAKNTETLEKGTVNDYFEEIFSASEGEIETKIQNSTKIKGSSLDDQQKRSVATAYDQYHLYRNKLSVELKLEDTMKEERETFLSKPIGYAQSGEKYVADGIQKIRDNWAGMDGKEKTMAGLTMLIGTAFFMNSNDEGVQKVRDALVKAGLLAVGYVGINATSKAFTGKSATRIVENYVEDRSGKRDFLKESFNANKEEADNIQTSLAVLGNNDFVELADMYLIEKSRCDTFSIPENLRGVSVGGVAENEMSPRNIYLAMKLLDKKLKKNNSSIEKLKNELEKAKTEAKMAGKEFISPTWLMIMTAVLKDQKLGYSFDKKGKIKVETASSIDTIWETNNKESTKKWWPLTGRPKDWQIQLVDKKPKETVNTGQLKKLSSTIIPEIKPLSDVITDKNFGRFTSGFENLYKNAYKKNQGIGQINTFQDTGEKAMYITSKVKVDTQTLPSKTAARLAAVEGAQELAITELKKKAETDPALKPYINRITEFVHPVFGTFIGQNADGAKEYVMFLRLTLPGSSEFTLRDKQEWPEGNMMEQMHEIQLTSGHVLTRADFKQMAERKDPSFFENLKIKKIESFKSSFEGAYESFLAKIKLSKSQETEIDKVLQYYGNHFSNSGMTKAGLVRYLATHEFTEDEIKTARGLGLDASAELPNSGTDVYGLIKNATVEANISDPTNEKKAYILTYLGTRVVEACNGDAEELAKITAFKPAFGKQIGKFTKELADITAFNKSSGDKTTEFTKETVNSTKKVAETELIKQYKEIIEEFSKTIVASGTPTEIPAKAPVMDKAAEGLFHNEIIREIKMAKNEKTGSDIIDKVKMALKKIERKPGFEQLYNDFTAELDKAQKMIGPRGSDIDKNTAPGLLIPEIDKGIAKYKSTIYTVLVDKKAAEEVEVKMAKEAEEEKKAAEAKAVKEEKKAAAFEQAEKLKRNIRW